MNILITICGRGGSKGIPGKNIKPLDGIPLIGYTIKSAKAFSSVYPSDIALSTDSAEILKIAKTFGLTSKYIRSPQLSSDSVGKMDVIVDLLAYEESRNQKVYDYVIDMDITSPLRTTEDIVLSLKMLEKDNKAFNIFSVSPASRNPYFNMVEKRGGEYVNLVKDAGEILSRQKAPVVYDMNASFYIYKRKYFHLNIKTPITDKSLVYVVPHTCFDLDISEDYLVMETLLRNGLLGFKI